MARCLARDLSSINFPQTGQQPPLLEPGLGEGGAVSEGVGRQEGGEEQLGELRQLRVLFTGSVLTARTARRVRGMAGVNISHCWGCFRVDFRAPDLPVLRLTGVLTLGVSLKWTPGCCCCLLSGSSTSAPSSSLVSGVWRPAARRAALLAMT